MSSDVLGRVYKIMGDDDDGRDIDNPVSNVLSSPRSQVFLVHMLSNFLALMKLPSLAQLHRFWSWAVGSHEATPRQLF